MLFEKNREGPGKFDANQVVCSVAGRLRPYHASRVNRLSIKRNGELGVHRQCLRCDQDEASARPAQIPGFGAYTGLTQPWRIDFRRKVNEAPNSILLSLPDSESTLRGIISTLSNPKGSIFIPVTAPIFLRKLRAGEQLEFGKITPESPCYEEYRSLLMTVLTEEFGIFAVPPAPAPREPRMAAKP